MDLADALELGELGEHERNRRLDAAIRVLFNPFLGASDIAGRYSHEKLAAARLLTQRLDRSLPKKRQLHLAHRALHAKQETIVGVAGIVNAVLVHDQGVDNAAELDQRMPIPPIAGEPGGLDRDDRADAPLADRGEQLLESRPGGSPTRTPEIIIDDLDPRPSEPARAIGKRILTAAALMVVEDLIHRRLAHIDERGSLEVFSGDLRHHAPPAFLARPADPRRPPPLRQEASAPASASAPADPASAPPPAASVRTDPGFDVVGCPLSSPSRGSESPRDEASWRPSTSSRSSSNAQTGKRGAAIN